MTSTRAGQHLDSIQRGLGPSEHHLISTACIAYRDARMPQPAMQSHGIYLELAMIESRLYACTSDALAYEISLGAQEQILCVKT